VNPFLLLILAYLLGATPTGLWVGKRFHGVDLRTVGSGNLGATNTFRILGWKAALPVMGVDVLKGWIPTWLFPRIDFEGAVWGWALAYGAAAILGHVYSVWVRFRGGKGVATSGGVFLALAPWAVLAAAAAWVVAVAITRVVSIGSVLAAVVLPFAVAFTPHQGGAALTWFSVGLAFFVIGAHRANLSRLLRGEEHRFGRAGDPGGGV
jgi:acyl phosphate:glycerol-3-phosphate acyltransferase